MKPKTSKHDDTPYMVPAYILHGVAGYMLDIDKVMSKFGINPGTGPVEIVELVEKIINEINADQPPINLTTVPTIDI